MMVEKNKDGSLVVSDIIKGYREARVYYGYTETAARQRFKQYYKKDRDET